MSSTSRRRRKRQRLPLLHLRPRLQRPRHHSQSVRVDIEKLDTLMNLMGELVINKVRLEQIGQTHRLADLTETLEQMDRVTTDLQNIVMKVRMVPVSSVFNRFPRMVRDIAKELNKEINLTIEGEETELDRTVIDEIGDPIMHLLRNSCDHGVEEPDVRESKGKPRAGEVGLIARHEGNNVVIMVKALLITTFETIEGSLRTSISVSNLISISPNWRTSRIFFISRRTNLSFYKYMDL